MLVSIAEGARLAGVSKSTLFKQIKRGAVSGVRDDVSGAWRVEISELERVYTLNSASAPIADTADANRSTAHIVSAPVSAEVQHLQARIAALELERDRLWQAFQAEAEERRNLTRLLTAPQPSADSSAPVQRLPWRRYTIIIVLELGAIAAGVAAYYWRDTIKTYAKAAVTAQPEPPSEQPSN
jgi:hypothetical protein